MKLLEEEKGKGNSGGKGEENRRGFASRTV